MPTDADEHGIEKSSGREPIARQMLVATALLWGGAGLLIRATPLAGPQLAFWRCLLAAIIYQAILLAKGHRPSMRQLRLAALGGVGFGGSLVLQFVAYKSTTLLSVNVIFALQPILLGIFAYRFHGTRHGGVAVIAMLLAVVGTIVGVLGSSSSGAFSYHGEVAALAATIVGCLYPVGIKHARATMEPLELQAAMLWVAAGVALPFAIVTGHGLIPPRPIAFAWIACIIAVGGTGHVLFTNAQRYVSVMASSTITLMQIVVIAGGAGIFFHQRINAVVVLGVVVVCGAVLWWVARVEPEGAIEPTA